MSDLECYRLPCPAQMVTNVCVCSKNYVAVPLNERGHIALWLINFPFNQPVILIGHHNTVTSLAFSHDPFSFYLCSCSSDYIILWDLLQNEGK
ncbi:WD repeat-containing protein 27-like [Stegodyphus dumicola]|uniref:WD repeat-containing protein 27-like n=1 Tax=Stegodyphus dumicola TaxID=202533 RepID=UPI0015B24AB4|nr:WD repeat-containing protein 27-like [Stegodyphus dumicola]